MDKKEALHEAAERLFRERGYESVSVREIAEAAGLSASSVSYYFGSKEALYREIFPEGELSGKETAARILSAATRLFAEDGYEKVSIRDIAKEAGAQSAAISYYFGGKPELYREVLYRGTSMISEFLSIIEKEKPDPAGVILLYGKFLVRLGVERPEVLRLILWEMMHGSDVFGAFVRERLSSVLAVIRSAVEDGIRAGHFREGVQPEEICIAWAGSILFFFLSRGIHKTLAPERTLTAEEYLAQMWGVFMEGIRKNA